MSEQPALPAAAASAANVDPRARKELLKTRARLLIALAIPVFLETLDYTVVATAQTHIASAFNRLDLQSYVGTVYLLTSAVFLPLFASLADIFGRLFALEAALLFFLVGSAFSTGSQNMPMMLAGRGISGVGAAGMLTVVRTILADSSSLDDKNWQSAALVILYTGGYSTGPTIGGALISVSFRWIFAINLPTSALGMVLVFLLLRHRVKGPQPPRINPNAYASSDPDAPPAKESLSTRLLRIDWVAASFFAVGGILLLLGLNWGSRHPDAWRQARTIVALTLGGILILLTVAWEALLERRQHAFWFRPADTVSSSADGTTEAEGRDAEKAAGALLRLPRIFACDALVPLAVLRNYDVSAAQFASLTSGMVMLTIFYFVSIFMVIVSGLSAVRAGVQLLFFAPGMGGGAIIAILIVKRLRQPRISVNIGLLLVPIALGFISDAMKDNDQDRLRGFMVMAGVGVGMTMGPVAIHARFSQPDDRVAIVLALQLFFNALGGTIGLAQCSTVMNAKVHASFAALPPDVLAMAGADPAQLSAASLSSLERINELPGPVQTLVRDAFRNGVRWCFISLIPWACVSFLLCTQLSNIRDTDALRRRHERAGAIPTEEIVQDDAAKRDGTARDA